MEIIEETFRNMMNYLPNLVAAVIVLILGWLLAWFISSLIRKGISRTRVDEKLKTGTGEEYQTGQWISFGVFWFIILLALVAFFSILELSLISDSLKTFTDQILAFLPRLLAGGILLLAAWIIASMLRLILSKGIKATGIDKRLNKLSEESQTSQIPLSKTLANAGYWLIFLLFLPAILNALALKGILTPVESMTEKILEFLPNLFVAGLILLVGLFFAKIISRIVTNVLVGLGIDRVGEKLGIGNVLQSYPISKIIGITVYIFILIPIVISSLDALKLQGITKPASDMLQQMLAAVPLLFGATAILAIAYLVGRLIAGLCTKLLSAMNFDSLPTKLGLGAVNPQSKWTPSIIVGHVILIIALLFASISALSLLKFDALANLMTQFTALLGHIIIGLLIFTVGLYFSNLVARIIKSSSLEQAKLLSIVARISILFLAGAMALRHMGLANEIITLGFGLGFGTVAVASAIAFGIGGRDLAARKLDEWMKSTKSD